MEREGGKRRREREKTTIKVNQINSRVIKLCDTTNP
jgi:hypothetical protein